MKIACLHLYLATQAGDPRMILSVAQALRKEGHAITVYCSEYKEVFSEALREGLDIKVIPPKAPLQSVLGSSGVFGKIKERFKRMGIYTDAALRIEKEMEGDFDVVLCENDYSYKAGSLYKKRNPRAKVIWIMNNPPFYHSKKKNVFENIFSQCVAWWEAIVAFYYSNGIDWAVVYDKENKRGSERSNIRAKIIGNPLDYKYFYAPVKKLDKNSPVTLLSVGALSPFRRFEETVSAVALLRKEGYNVRARIICKDYWSDASYRKAFEQHIKDSGVSEFIDAHFEGVSEAEMLKYIHESHISVVPQVAKVWVATACEAMTAGLPLIITNETSMFDVLEDNNNVLFVPPFSPEKIAQKVKLLIDEPHIYQKIASSGQKFVEDNLSFESFVHHMLLPPRDTNGKFERIISEFVSAFFLYKNFWTYMLCRAKLLSDNQVILFLRNGISYALRAKTNEIDIVKEIWHFKIYDTLLHYVQDDAVVIDIGANIGVFSIKAARRANNVRVFSYEPMIGNNEMLKRNIMLNGLERFVTPFLMAVSDKKGEQEIFFTSGDSGGASFHNYKSGENVSSIKVPCTTLSDIFKENNINKCDFLKMDCEGAEEAIILNAPKELFQKISSMTIEWHQPLNKLSIEEFRSLLFDVGYKSEYNSNTLTLYAWRKNE